jgi:hypothetical protein
MPEHGREALKPRGTRLRRALLALALLGFLPAAQAAPLRVEMLYLGTHDCPYCVRWEARSRPSLLASVEGRSITYVEVRGETLRKPITQEHYPRDYAWAFEQIGPSRGVPRWAVFVNGKLVLNAVGLTAYDRDVLPILKELTARSAAGV